MILFPNAKINLGLDILFKREDGYHEVVTAMTPVGWHDILEIVPARGTETTLTTSGRPVNCPTEKNLVMKAYRAMAEAVNLPPVDIYLRKIIPDGAGLGGGSADAAFMLRARKFVNTGLVGIIPQRTERAIGNSLFLSRFGLTLVSSPLG